MLLRAEKQVFQKPGWIYEPKLDGMRCIAICNGESSAIYSRNGRNISQTFPALCRSLGEQRCGLVLDGEIVAFDTSGRVSFENLQKRWLIADREKAFEQDACNPVAYFVFDVLQADHTDVTRQPLAERKQVLLHTVAKSLHLKYVDDYDDAVALFEVTRSGGIEGIVAKRSASLYKPGVRSADWIKIKHRLIDTFVVLAYVDGEGFLLGRIGVGGLEPVGYSQYGLSRREYDRLVSRLTPVTALEKTRKQMVWFKPEILVEVEFMKWTSEGRLRFPVLRQVVSG